MKTHASWARTLVSALTSGLVAGGVVLAGLAVGPLVGDALASPGDEVALAEPCDDTACKSKKGRFDDLEAKKASLEGLETNTTTVAREFVAAGKAALRGATTLSGPTRLEGATSMAGSTVFEGTTEARGPLTVKKSLTVEDSLVVKGDLAVEGTLKVLGKLEIKGKMSFPSKQVSCVDTKTSDRQDKVCPIGEFSLCVPTHQSGICELDRSSSGSWTLSARNPRPGMSPSMCEAVCW